MSSRSAVKPSKHGIFFSKKLQKWGGGSQGLYQRNKSLRYATVRKYQHRGLPVAVTVTIGLKANAKKNIFFFHYM